MTEVLHRKVRWRSARLHLVGLIWIPIYIATYQPIDSITSQIWYAISGERRSQGAPGFSEWITPAISACVTTPIISIGLAIISLLLIWKVSHDVHLFVDLAGRSTINLLLSINLYFLILFVLGIMIPIILLFGLLPLLGLLLPLAHIALASWGAISAWNGQVYAPLLTIKFLK
jgi:uncharacterized Tic20 family protein